MLSPGLRKGENWFRFQQNKFGAGRGKNSI
jgi:hypothetical protein